MNTAPTMPPDPSEWDGQGPDPDQDVPDVLQSWDAPESGQAPARPTIRIQAGQLPRMIHETIHALGEHDPNLYQRSLGLVRIVREPERREPYERDMRRGSSIIMRPGTPRLVDASGVLLERCATVAHWERWDGRKGSREGGGKGGKASGEWVEANPDGAVVRAIAVRGDWPGIRPIRGIAETPFLAPSGRIVQEPGWNEETCVALLPSCDVGPVIETPTQEHARAALRYLWTEIACDFPFRGLGEPDHEKDPDRALHFAKALDVPDAFVGVAMLLTIFARLAIGGAVPGGMFEAAGQGSGKSLQIHTIAMVATSRPASVASFPVRDGKPNEEELEKVLAGYALAGARIVAFDNIRGLLAGATLERALTAVENIDLRVLGSNDQKSLPWAATMMFSGNNMSMNDDVAQRLIVSRIESKRENPRSRPSNTFRHPSLLAAIKERRARLVRAVLVILRAYLVARDRGDDVPTFSRGSFEQWAAIIPGALRYAGGPDILRAFPEEGRGGDEESEAHATLLRWWRDEWQGQRAASILDMLFRGERRAHEEGGDGYDEPRAAVRALTRTREGQTPSAHSFGIRLRDLRGKIRNGAKIDCEVDSKTRASLWRVVQVEGA